MRIFCGATANAGNLLGGFLCEIYGGEYWRVKIRPDAALCGIKMNCYESLLNETLLSEI